MLINEVAHAVEALALEHLCSPSPEIRSTAVDLLEAVYLLCHQHGHKVRTVQAWC